MKNFGLDMGIGKDKTEVILDVDEDYITGEWITVVCPHCGKLLYCEIGEANCGYCFGYFVNTRFVKK